MEGRKILRKARRRAGLTQAELARRAGTTQSAVSRWERGGTDMGLASLANLLHACGFELRFGLVDLDEPAPGPASELLVSDQLDANLALTPAQRLDQLVRAVDFIRRGRRAMADQGG